MKPATVRVDADLFTRARKIAQHYRIIIERDGRTGYIGQAIELPDVYASGGTPESCYENTAANVAKAVAMLLQKGLLPPTPDDLPKNENLHIRLTADEKIVLEQRAKQQGFKGTSDYARHILLAPHRC